MKLILLLGLIGSFYSLAQKKGDGTHTPVPGVVASGEVEYGVMMTIKGRTSISRFIDKDKKMVCYMAHHHQTDTIQTMSCEKLGK